MRCSRCDKENSDDRSNCVRCGAELAPIASSPPPQKVRRVRMAVVLPICAAGIILMVSCYARWRATRSETTLSSNPAVQSDSPDAEQPTSEATARVRLVNARANDLLRTGDALGALKVLDELPSGSETDEIQETRIY